MHKKAQLTRDLNVLLFWALCLVSATSLRRGGSLGIGVAILYFVLAAQRFEDLKRKTSLL